MVAPVRLASQTGATAAALYAGAAALEDDSARLIAPTLGAEWQRQAVRYTLRAGGTALVASNGRWAAQGSGTASWFSGTASSPRELGATGELLRPVAARPVAFASIFARQYVSMGNTGGWVGLTAGSAIRDRPPTPFATFETALWRQGASWRGGLALSGTAARLPRAAIAKPARTIYVAADLATTLDWRTSRLEIGMTAGVRRTLGTAWQGRPRTTPLALASVTVAFGRSLAIVGVAGVQPPDPIQGTGRVRHLALALRLRPGTRRLGRPRLVPSAGGPTGPATGPASDGRDAATYVTLQVTGSGASRVVRVTTPPARRVEIRADDTGWQSVRLEGSGTTWTVTLPLAPGTHRVMLRVDDGPWGPPANLPAVDDGFGSRVGLLVVP